MFYMIVHILIRFDIRHSAKLSPVQKSNTTICIYHVHHYIMVDWFCRDLYRESAVREFIRREGQAPAEEDLYHKDKKRPPKFRTQIKNLTTLKENDSAHFECKLMPYGDPTMKVEWYKDNQPLHHGQYQPCLSVCFRKRTCILAIRTV